MAHCGNSLAGSFIWSLTFTDIYSGWTENRAIWNKGSGGVLAQVQDIEAHLAFPLLGFDSDNGSEFLNHHLGAILPSPSPVAFTAAALRKNDNAHVEQKHWTHGANCSATTRSTGRKCSIDESAVFPRSGSTAELLLSQHEIEE